MSKKTRAGRGPAESPNGAYTLVEILDQPVCWSESLKSLERTGALKTLAARFAEGQEWIFVGCGSAFTSPRLQPPV